MSFHPIRDTIGELALQWVAVTAIIFDPFSISVVAHHPKSLIIVLRTAQ